MARKRKQIRRTFGRVRELPSGRFQASYRHDGQVVNAPRTFPTETDANAWLVTIESDLTRGVLKATPRATPTLDEYAPKWIAQHRGIKRSTRALYDDDVSRYVLPYLGDYRISAITPLDVRDWEGTLRADLAESLAKRAHHTQATRQTGEASAARAYRTLRAMLNTAVEDQLILTNPCKLKGAGTAPSAERPTLSAAEVFTLADEVPGQYRAVVLLASFVGLRIGELAALRPKDLHLGTRPSVSVNRRVYRTATGELDYDSPKSAAGVRTIALPEPVAQALREHLEQYRADAEPEDLVFVTRNGCNIRGGAYGQALPKALRAIGRPDVRVHDLRHTGITAAAETGAGLPELMQRLGDSTVAAAQVYLHATEDHGRKVSDDLGDVMAKAAKAEAKRKRKAAKAKAEREAIEAESAPGSNVVSLSKRRAG